MSVGARALAAVVGLALLSGCELILDFSPLGDAGPGTPDSGGPADAASCLDDYEPNPSIEMARAIEPGIVREAICPTGDEDFYSFTVDGTVDVHFLLTFEAGANDLELELYDASSPDPKVVSTGIDGNEEIAQSASSGNRLDDGTYFIRVFGRAGAVGNAYELSWERSVAAAAAP